MTSDDGYCATSRFSGSMQGMCSGKELYPSSLIESFPEEAGRPLWETEG